MALQQAHGPTSPRGRGSARVGGMDFSELLRGVLWGPADVADFDAFTAALPESLRGVWVAVSQGRAAAGYDDEDSRMLVAVGWSPIAGSFKAVMFSSDHDFEPHPLSGPFSQPSPLDVRLSRPEADQYRRLGSLPGDLLERWERQPPLHAPRNTAGWVELGQRVREQRSMLYPDDTCLKIVVGGELHATTLRRGELTTRRVHTFDDTGEDLLRLVQGTAHPVSLASPCGCLSGRLFGDCHAASN